jgi:hypothetical protein
MFGFKDVVGLGFYGILITLFFVLMGAMPATMLFCLIILTGLAIYFNN